MAAQAGVPPLRGADKAKATNSQGVASAGRRTFTLAPVFASPCGIALDEARGVLYVSEVDAHRVRALRVPPPPPWAASATAPPSGAEEPAVDEPANPADEHPEMRKLYSSLREEVRNSESPPPASTQYKKQLTMPPI